MDYRLTCLCFKYALPVVVLPRGSFLVCHVRLAVSLSQKERRKSCILVNLLFILSLLSSLTFSPSSLTPSISYQCSVTPMQQLIE